MFLSLSLGMAGQTFPESPPPSRSALIMDLRISPFILFIVSWVVGMEGDLTDWGIDSFIDIKQVFSGAYCIWATILGPDLVHGQGSYVKIDFTIERWRGPYNELFCVFLFVCLLN